eukprot:Skav216336  [mRNA]  locus=scaffold3350:338319:340532:+ [translate_table: standard]
MANFVHGPGTAKAVFEADGFGPDRLSLKAGERLRLLPHEKESEKWAYGQIADGSCGWVPRQFWKQDGDDSRQELR